MSDLESFVQSFRNRRYKKSSETTIPAMTG